MRAIRPVSTTGLPTSVPGGGVSIASDWAIGVAVGGIVVGCTGVGTGIVGTAGVGGTVVAGATTVGRVPALVGWGRAVGCGALLLHAVTSNAAANNDERIPKTYKRRSTQTPRACRASTSQWKRRADST